MILPATRQEMEGRGWSGLDILLVSGDAYVDHPSFGVPLLGRVLEREGFRVGIVAQPRFKNETEVLEDLRRMGAPRLFTGIGAGAVDSMLNNYTASKKPRSDDMYSPGGRSGMRPDYATVVYTKFVKRAFVDVPVVVGGVEASLRRLAHYDFWLGRVRPSVLVESGADALVFGMAERQIVALAKALRDAAVPGREALQEALRQERGVAWLSDDKRVEPPFKYLRLPSFEEVRDDKRKFLRSTMLVEAETNPYNAKALVQRHGSRMVVINPPVLPMSEQELDAIHELPFTRRPHPSYKEKITAHEMIKYSVTVNRGCFGGCSFCSLALHQGRIVQSRSERSVLEEIKGLARLDGFNGIVSDVGGPTANMYALGCGDEQARAACRRPSCLYPKPCPRLITSQRRLTALLKKARALPGIRKVLVASGVRFDLALLDPEFLEELVRHHVGGHLKVAPEHADDRVLALMRKPGFALFEKFLSEFERISKDAGKAQFVVPYFISAFPGSTPEAMRRVREWLGRKNWRLQQVQLFIPTPMTRATALFWSGIDPESGRPLFTAREKKDREEQRLILQPHRARAKRSGGR